MQEITFWEMPPEPGPTVRAVTDEDGDIWVRKTGSYGDGHDGWHHTTILPARAPRPGQHITTSAGGKHLVCPEPSLWIDLLVNHGKIRDVTGQMAIHTLPH